MTRKLIALLLALLMLYVAVPTAAAQPDEKQISKWKALVAHARVAHYKLQVVRSDGSQVIGTVEGADDNSFLFRNDKTGSMEDFFYTDITKVKKPAPKALVVAGMIGLGILAGALLAAEACYSNGGRC